MAVDRRTRSRWRTTERRVELARDIAGQESAMHAVDLLGEILRTETEAAARASDRPGPERRSVRIARQCADRRRRLEEIDDHRREGRVARRKGLEQDE